MDSFSSFGKVLAFGVLFLLLCRAANSFLSPFAPRLFLDGVWIMAVFMCLSFPAAWLCAVLMGWVQAVDLPVAWSFYPILYVGALLVVYPFSSRLRLAKVSSSVGVAFLLNTLLLLSQALYLGFAQLGQALYWWRIFQDFAFSSLVLLPTAYLILRGLSHSFFRLKMARYS